MILYVLRYFPTYTETFVHGEIRALHRLGVPVEVAALGTKAPPGTATLPVPVHACPHRWGWLGALPALAVEWLRRPARVSRRVLWLATLARRARRVHVHFAGESAAWAAEAADRAGVPFSVTVHAVDLFQPMPGVAALLGRARPVLAISEFNRAELLRRHGIAAVLARCGVDAERMAGMRREAISRAGEALVLCVARDVPKKGIEDFGTVARRLAGRARFVLVSDRPALAGVEVLGLRPHDEVLRLVASAAVLVAPCRRAETGDMDGIPVVLMEALAMGVPVVTTAVSGIPELVDEEVGWVVAEGDVERLVAAVAEALDDPAGAAGRGARGPGRVRDRGFTADAAAAVVRDALLPGPA